MGMTTGINGMYQQNTVTNGTEFIIPSYHQFDLGPFAMIKKTFDKLDISGGIRYDSRSFSNQELYTAENPVTHFDMPVYGADTVGAVKPFSNYHHVFSGVSGSLGATYSFSNKLSAKAEYFPRIPFAEYFRNFFQRSSSGYRNFPGRQSCFQTGIQSPGRRGR